MLRAEADFLLAAPSTAAALIRGLERLAAAAAEAGDAAVRINRLTARLESLLDEVEEPLKAAAPGIRRVGRMLDDPAVSELPETLNGLRETQARVAAIAASTERITSFIDDTGSRLGALPGLLRRPFRLTETPLPETVNPLPPDPG